MAFAPLMQYVYAQNLANSPSPSVGSLEYIFVNGAAPWTQDEIKRRLANTDSVITDEIKHNISEFLAQKYGGIDILNTQSYPTVGGLWTINFTLSGSDDLIITPINGTTFGIFPDDVEFVSLVDGSGNSFVPNHVADSLKFSNFSSPDVISLNLLVHTPGEHHLKFEFGNKTAYAHNMATPSGTTKIASGTTNFATLVNSDLFGISVANIGDIDRDGVNDIAVGVGADDTGGSNRGAIYIITLNSNKTVKAYSKIASGTTDFATLVDHDWFGSSVANIGDIDRDGVNDIAVGASYDDMGGTDRGAIYIITPNSNKTVKA